ncbi:MAG: hypothetical protein R3D25_17945 [Geminicoccaceae bacterium]
MAMATQDYRLTARTGRAAVASGLAGATWYASPIPRKEMKELMRRTDSPAIRDTVLWLLILGSPAGCSGSPGGAGGMPVFLVYSVFYGSCGDSRWHECGHGTAFRTP